MRFLAALSVLATLLVAAPAVAAEAIGNLTPPVITGDPAFGNTLTSDQGTWDQPDVVVGYQWFRDGVDIESAESSTYLVRLDDIGHQLSVTVTATKPGFDNGAATSDPTAVVRPGRLIRTARPAIPGVPRFQRTLVATAGRWAPKPTSLRFQWLRNGRAIKGATRKRYTVAVPDVGARLAVRVTARRVGYRNAVAVSRAVLGRHRVAVRHRVTYSISTRGVVHADLATFARLAQQTYDDPRGWRGAGVEFRRVRSGGSFRLVLSQASKVPTFGYPCDSTWSCRVGNFVIINQDRWLGASPMWNARGRSLRDYRHMVVNHETGHWLGHRHSYCGGPGKLAPVMMQQSKGLHRCRPNPWPLPGERTTPRF